MPKNTLLLLFASAAILTMGARCALRGTENLDSGNNVASTSVGVAVTKLPTTCTNQPEGTPVITALSVSSGSVGTKLEIQGCNFAGFEGDKSAWIENSQGAKGLLFAEDGSTSNLLKVTLRSPLCQKDTSASGLPCDAWITLTPGTYKIYTTPWNKKSNEATFTIKPAATTNVIPWATKTCGANRFGSLNRGQGLTASGQFQGVAIADIAKNYLALSNSQADALTAIISTDDRQLVVAYVSCDGATGQDVNGTTPDKNFSLDGTVAHLVAFTGSDAKTGHYLTRLPGFSGSNFGAVFVPVGFIAKTSRVLMRGEKYDMAAGGSCATTYWMTVDASSAAKTKFSTDPDLIIYENNTHIVYVSPNPCVTPPWSIRVKNVTTGSDQLIQKLSGDSPVSMQKVEEQHAARMPTRFVLHYTVYDSSSNTSTPATIILP